jgi:sarcosine oxidase subunit gamma
VTVLGPRSVELLRTCSALDLRERSVPNLRCAQTSLARVHAVVARNDVGTLPAYALLFSRDYAEFVWEWLIEMGHEFGVQPIGISALEQLHRELAAPAGEAVR